MRGQADFEAALEKLSNWGRWGPDDQRGTLNLITDHARMRAVASVSAGSAYSLAIPLGHSGPQDGKGIPGRVNPIRTMLAINVAASPSPAAAAYNDDIVTMPVQAATHWDALSHVSYQGAMYNGVPANAVTSAGATRLGIDAFGPVVSRGVLLDLPRYLGKERLPGGFEVSRELLEACEESQQSAVLPGDILLVRTGHIQLLFDGNVDGYHAPAPGLGLDTAEWFQERQVAAVAADTIAFELFPSPRPDVSLPLHVLCLNRLGLPIGETFALDVLARDCAEDGRYTCLLEASPEPFENSTGGMVNPVAIRL